MLCPFRTNLASTFAAKRSLMKSEETMLNDAGVAILGRAEHISTETEDKFSHTVICSIGVLQMKGKHDNGIPRSH